MELKVISGTWSAGLPVVMLNKKTAERLGVHAKERLAIRTLSKKPKQISSILDVVGEIIKDDEIAISDEIKKILGIRKGQKVDISISSPPRSLGFIKKKLDGKKLLEKEIKEIIKDIVNNSLSETEVSLFVSAMYQKGMDFNETIHLIEAILSSGKRLSFKNKFVVDKHSIGGIPGNRTTPIVVSICASAGLIFPKSSSRAITSAAGTADVIETLAKVEFSIDELKKIVKKTNACMVWGGALGMVPADSKIITIEKQLRIDPESQLLASILSKKLAAGSKYILIDIPYGKLAKVSKSKALNLKKKFEDLGKHFKLKLKVVLTDGSNPIGKGVGPVLEMIDVIKILNPLEEGPKDLEKKSLFLAGEIFELTRKAKKGKGFGMAKEILDSGKAFKKFEEIIKTQKGKIIKLKPAKYKKDIFSKRNCKFKGFNNKVIGSLARTAGCPLDKKSGVYLHVKKGDELKKKSKILTIYAESKPRLKEAIKFYKSKKPLLMCFN